MSHRVDPVFQTIHWLQGQRGGTEGLENALFSLWDGPTSGQGINQVASVTVGSIRYIPYEWAGVAARCEIVPMRDAATNVPTSLMLHVHADPSRAVEEVDAACERVVAGGAGPPPVALLRDRIVVWSVAGVCGPSIHGDLVDPEAWRECDARLAATVDDWPACGPMVLKRWSPLERAVFLRDRPDGGRYRVELDVDGYRAAETALALSEAADAVRAATYLELPRLVGYCPDARGLIVEEPRGASLAELAGRLRPGGYAAVGAAIAEMHDLQAVPTAPLTAGIAMADRNTRVDRICRAVPRLAARAKDVGRLLDDGAGRLAPGLPRSIHGDLRADRVLCRIDTVSGARRVAIEAHRARRSGDPHHDLGRLIAHLILIDGTARIGKRRLADRLKALLDAYQGAAGVILHRPTLDWHVAASLLNLADRVALQPLVRGWYLHVDYAVTAARHLLRGEGDFVLRRDQPPAATRKAGYR